MVVRNVLFTFLFVFTSMAIEPLAHAKKKRLSTVEDSMDAANSEEAPRPRRHRQRRPSSLDENFDEAESSDPLIRNRPLELSVLKHEILVGSGSISNDSIEGGTSTTSANLSFVYYRRLGQHLQWGPLLYWTQSDSQSTTTLGLGVAYNLSQNILHSPYLFARATVALQGSATSYGGGFGWKLALSPNISYNPYVVYAITSSSTMTVKSLSLKYLNFSLLF